MQHKLGCVLFQLPPSFTYSETYLQKIVETIDKTFLNVLEFRHSSWWRPDVFDELAKHGISFCGMSHPKLPDEVVANTSSLYYRMHGDSELYASNYSEKQLEALAGNINIRNNVREIYVYFNNDIHAHAIYNAKYLENSRGLKY